MKAKKSLAMFLVSAALASLPFAFSACSDSQNENIQLPRVESNPYASSTQPLEKVRLEGLRFKSNGASLRSGSKPILDAAVEVLEKEPDNQVFVDAYYNRAHSAKADQELAQKRAENVKAYLEARGIPPERLIARGFTDASVTTSSNEPRSDRQISRVELITFPNEAAAPTNFADSSPEVSKVN